MAFPVLGEYLDLVLEARLDEASSALAAAHARESVPGGRARLAAVAAFASALAARHGAARRWAELARADADDEPSRAMASAAEQFSACLAPPGEGIAPAGGPGFEPAWADEDVSVSGYLAVEASMSSGRLVDAERIALDFLAQETRASAQARIFARIGLARSLAFQGRVEEAAANALLATTAAEARGGVPARMLAAATTAYIEAQRGNGAETERLTVFVLALDPDPRSYIPVGSHILCAYGLAAIGSVDRAAQLVLSAAGGPALGRARARGC